MFASLLTIRHNESLHLETPFSTAWKNYHAGSSFLVNIYQPKDSFFISMLTTSLTYHQYTNTLLDSLKTFIFNVQHIS